MRAPVLRAPVLRAPVLRLAAALAGLVLAASAARGEEEISLYAGAQGALGSEVSARGAAGGFAFDADWEGRPFEPAPYYGLRVASWRGDGWGLYADFTHSKAYAARDTLEDAGFERLEFTHGVNVATIGVARRIEAPGGWAAYAGVGLGVAVPHVEVERGGRRTYAYQFGGPAAELRLGATHPLGPRLSAFAEYEANAVALDVDLVGGGAIETRLVTQAINLGLSYRLGRR